MSGVAERPVGRWSAQFIFYALAIGSGVMRALSIAADYVALGVHKLYYPQGMSAVVYGVISQWVSFVVTFTTVLILSIKWQHRNRRRPLGYSLDPDFGSIRVLPRRPMFYVVVAGLFAGISTTFYYIMLGWGTNVSAVLPFGQLVVIYLLIGDLLAEKDTPTLIEVQCIMSILFGVLLVGVSPSGFETPDFLILLLVVLGPLNLSYAMITYFQRKTKRYTIAPGLRVDSLNMRLWSLLVLNTVFTVFAIPMAAPEEWVVFTQLTWEIIFWMAFGSIATFLSIAMYIQALGKGTMAIVNSLSSISVVLGIPIGIVGHLVLPTGFEEVGGTPTIWVLRIIGVTLVLLGILALETSDVRSIILIRVKPATGDLLPALFQVRGVESASALAGTHDYLLSVRSRSLAKTRKQIIKRIQEIEGVTQVNTLIVLKEYR